MKGSLRKYELVGVLSKLFDIGRVYSSVDIEKIIRLSVKKEVLSDPAFAEDHLRVAMVEQKVFIRDRNENYELSENVNFFQDSNQTTWKWLNEQERLNPNDKVRCPICSKLAYPKILVRHYRDSHKYDMQQDLYVDKINSLGWEHYAKKYLNV